MSISIAWGLKSASCWWKCLLRTVFVLWMALRRPKACLLVTCIVGCFFVFWLRFKETKPEPKYETVMDCITKEQRRAGIVGHVKTIEFTQVETILYKNSINSQTASGPPSTVEFSSETAAGLHAVIIELKRLLGVSRIRMLDIPCGDMDWMNRFLDSRDDVIYTGIDISPELILSHQKTYADRPWTFIHRDIIPDGVGAQYDLIFSRQMLQHLLSSDVITVLQQISRSDSLYLLATSFPDIHNNSDFSQSNVEHYRPLNLEAPPINLAPPLCFFRDGPNPNNERSLMLFELPLRQVVGCTEAKPMKIILSSSRQNYSYYSCGNWSV